MWGRDKRRRRGKPLSPPWKIITLIKNVVTFGVQFVDILVVLLLLNLRHYYVYYHTVLLPPSVENWWQWPVHHGWSILGKVPRLDEKEYYSRSTAFSSPTLVKYLPKPQQNEEKLILFHHIPMEDIQRQLDPRLCGGKCRIAFNDSEHNHLSKEADAVVFSLKFPKTLPKRR